MPSADDGVETQRSLSRILTLRVRLIFIHAEETLGRLMMNVAKRNGMLNGDYLFVGSTLWTYVKQRAACVVYLSVALKGLSVLLVTVWCCRFGSDEDHKVDFNEEERSYLQGVVGMSLSIPTPAVYDAFHARLAKLTPQLYPVRRVPSPNAHLIAMCFDLAELFVL